MLVPVSLWMRLAIFSGCFSGRENSIVNQARIRKTYAKTNISQIMLYLDK
jgi:hypothetical protein